MVLIPPDAGLRMRLQNDANALQPVAPVHELPSDLPDLQVGQRFTARIQEALPDNSYKALVAGKQLTLQLPEGAGAGDQLELVVIDRSPRVVIARQVDTAGSGEAAPYPFARFSPAARLIGQLLPAEGEAPPPAQLNRGQPLVAQPPQSQAAVAELASRLTQSVTQSGLFYEAHQAQWIAGKRSLEILLQEPQGRKSSPAAFQHAAAEVAARAISTADRPMTAEAVMQALQASSEKLGAGGAAQGTAQAQSTQNLAQQVPDDLRPLVQQQLDAAGTQRMIWQGEIWPQQTMEWEIERESEREADGSTEEEARWRTSLSLTTPRLGRVDANLQLSSRGVAITLATPHGASAADLRATAPLLAAALEAAGVPLLAFQVKEGT